MNNSSKYSLMQLMKIPKTRQPPTTKSPHAHNSQEKTKQHTIAEDCNKQCLEVIQSHIILFESLVASMLEQSRGIRPEEPGSPSNQNSTNCDTLQITKSLESLFTSRQDLRQQSAPGTIENQVQQMVRRAVARMEVSIGAHEFSELSWRCCKNSSEVAACGPFELARSTLSTIPELELRF